MRMTPLRPTLATALAAFLALLSVSVVGGIVAGSGPFCGLMGRIPRNVVKRVAAAFALAEAPTKEQREEGIANLSGYASRCPHLSPMVLPVLRKALSDAEPLVRRSAIRGLASLGAQARDALPSLEHTRGKDIPFVDYLITEAVFTITAAEPSRYEEDGCEALSSAEIDAARAKWHGDGIPDARW
jgi:hypothetical protein